MGIKNSLDMKNSKKNITNNYIEEVKSTYFFRKLSREDAYRKLSGVFNYNNKKYTYTTNESNDSLLLKTCKLIGDIEKIEFIAAFKSSSEAWSPL